MPRTVPGCAIGIDGEGLLADAYSKKTLPLGPKDTCVTDMLFSLLSFTFINSSLHHLYSPLLNLSLRSSPASPDSAMAPLPSF